MRLNGSMLRLEEPYPLGDVSAAVAGPNDAARPPQRAADGPGGPDADASPPARVSPPTIRDQPDRQAASIRSTAAAIRNSRPSRPLRAASMRPTGIPPAAGNGSEIAHRSKKLTIAVLRSSS